LDFGVAAVTSRYSFCAGSVVFVLVLVAVVVVVVVVAMGDERVEGVVSQKLLLTSLPGILTLNVFSSPQ
jgi:hypothetical protein